MRRDVGEWGNGKEWGEEWVLLGLRGGWVGGEKRGEEWLGLGLRPEMR